MDDIHTERITEWVIGGPYVVAVEVGATIHPDRPDSPCLSRNMVLHLENVARQAEAGNVEALKEAGTVYVKLEVGSERRHETNGTFPSVPRAAQWQHDSKDHDHH
jgi:hypothetical protein